MRITDRYKSVSDWLEGERLTWPSHIKDAGERARRWKELAEITDYVYRREVEETEQGESKQRMLKWIQRRDEHIANLTAEEQMLINNGVHPSLFPDFINDAQQYAARLHESLSDIREYITIIQAEIPHGGGVALVVHLKCAPNASCVSIIPEFFQGFRVFRVGEINGRMLLFHPIVGKLIDMSTLTPVEDD